MNFDFGFYSDKLPTFYLSSIKKLQLSLDTAFNEEEKNEAFQNFTETFTTIPCIWEEWARICAMQFEDNDVEEAMKKMKFIQQTFLKAQFHFVGNYLMKIEELRNIDYSCYYKWLLDLYSRYCRFFVDDLEMRRIYRKAIQRIERIDNFNVTKWKIDCIKFKRDFHSKESAVILMNEYFEDKTTNVKNLNFTLKWMETKIFKNDKLFPDYAIDKNSIKPYRTSKPIQFKLDFCQNFALPNTLISTILKNAKYQILSKLYSASKELYSVMKIPICHKIEICKFYSTTVSFQHSLFVSNSDMNFTNAIKGIYLANALIITNTPKNRIPLTKILPKIYKCEIRYLQVYHQIFTFDEFKFITKFVENFYFSNSEIKEDDRIISLKDMIEIMPFVSEIFVNRVPLFPAEFNGNTKERIVRIQRFNTLSIYDTGDVKYFINYIFNLAAPNSSWDIQISNNDIEYKQRLKTLIQKKLKLWKPENEKPKIRVT